METDGLDKTINSTDGQYSSIIDPIQYNRIINEEHLYITSADKYIANFIQNLTNNKEEIEVVELGCGPGRMLPLIRPIKNINLTLVDHDLHFIQYAKTLASSKNIKIELADVTTYKHHCKVDIFFSQGMHHHIHKGEQTSLYLKNIYSQLKEGGCYILSDEFIPNYKDENDRGIKLVIWYSHIIANALKLNYFYLAQEEAKTLLDDLHQGYLIQGYKTGNQIETVLDAATIINDTIVNDDPLLANDLALVLLRKLNMDKSTCPSGNKSNDLSREDYKISEGVLRDEINAIGFVIESSKNFGPISNIGSMTVYCLKKQ